MKHPIILLPLFVCLLAATFPKVSAQTEFGIRPLFFQNDFIRQNHSFDRVAQGHRAGEWQFGVSVRKYFSDHIAGRLETNLATGRYRLGDNSDRFFYLNLCAIPEWRISQVVSFGAGGFFSKSISDPLDTPKSIETGLLANLALRHGQIEIQCRFQKWLADSGKFTLGAGFDYYFGIR